MTPIEEPAAAEIVGLSIAFPSPRGPVRVVEEASFSVRRGEVLGLVGESGSGKSVTALALTGLLAMAGGRREAGRICLDGADVTDIPDAAWRKLRGSAVSMIFQDPLMSLNPVYRVGAQVAEALERHRWMSRRAAWRRAVELFDQVGLPDPEERARAFPHQLSGGMRQRVMIAMALACEPKLLIADEPTTALDVTIQAQILALIDRLRRETGTAVLFISHDLGVVSQIADRVAVIYAGRIVETAPAARLFETPEHPYTIGLLGSAPDLDQPDQPLVALPGAVPRAGETPPGCSFAPRCPYAEAACDAATPALRTLAPGHGVACRRAPLAA